jgi:DNA-binding NtrC family response regulator
MLTIWIIHRDAHHRAALARIAGAGDSAVLGAPSDRLFESASAPGVVVLGLSGDFEQELEFVHRHAAKLQGSAWVLLPTPSDLPEARRLFDTVAAQYVSYPPNPVELRRALRAALKRRSADSLSSRQGRDGLRERFARWFNDLDLPELLRAVDPRLAGLPVLVRGEEGTGRALLARYVHAFCCEGDEAFIHVSCGGIRRAGELLGQIASGMQAEGVDSFTIWLEDVDRMPLSLQRRVQHWIEFGLPEGVLRVAKLRWIAGAGDDGDLDADPGLEPRLAEALSGLTIAIPPLRERTAAVSRFVEATAASFCETHGERERRFSADTLLLLRAYPWPGNLHELEAVVTRTLSFSSADPLLPVHLRFPGDSGWLDHFEPSEPEPEPELAPEPPTIAATPAPVEAESDLPEAIVLGEAEPESEPIAAAFAPSLPAEDETWQEDESEAEVEVEDEPEEDIDEESYEESEPSEQELEAFLRPFEPGEDALAEAEVLQPLAAAEPTQTVLSEIAPPPGAVDLATAAAESVLPPAPEPPPAVFTAAPSTAAAPTAAAPTASAPTATASSTSSSATPSRPSALGAASDAEETDLRRLVRAVAHEVRNPLVSIRTFSELLPDHYDDPEFRTHFRELVGQDVQRIDGAVSRLQGMLELETVHHEPVDVADLLESLLDEHRDEIQKRRLLVLKELDHNLPEALGDRSQLRDAFAGLLHRALDEVSERGDIYLASKHHSASQSGEATLRVLLRYTTSPESQPEPRGAPTSAAEIDRVMAETVIRAIGGSLTVDTTDAQECVIVVDLPAPE